MSGKKGSKQGGNTVSTVRALALPLAEALSLRVWDIRFEKEGASWYLRIFIDKPGGVTIEDCEALSRAIDPVLDEADPISVPYYLEVSSPGLGRALTCPAHFEEMMGREVRVLLYAPVDGRREFTGALSGYSGEAVSIETDEGPRSFPRASVSRVKLNDDDFGGFNE